MEPGKIVLVHYGEDMWHERLLLCHIANGRWMIMTPDNDIYAEDYGPGGTDVEAVRVRKGDGSRPAGLARARIYGWVAGRLPTGDALREVLEEGRQIAALERGGAGPPPPPELGGGAGAGGADDGVKKWVFADLSAKDVGEPSEDPAAELDDVGLVRVDGAVRLVHRLSVAEVEKLKEKSKEPKVVADSGSDARVLGIMYEPGGARRREWKSVSDSAAESAMGDWPIDGPRTAGWVAAFIARRGTAPRDHHRWWRSTAKLAASDWGVTEHAMLCDVLEHAGSYDNLDICNLACIEALARRLQTIEYQHRERVRDGERGGHSSVTELGGTAVLTDDEMDFFQGRSHASSTVCCSPALIKHVADGMEKEALIAKQSRKAREEKGLARSPPNKDKGGKGGGKPP